MQAVAIAVLVIAGAPFLHSQPTEDSFQTAIKFNDGRFVADRNTARVVLSDHFTKLLRPGITIAQLTTQFCDALDREFRLMPKPYFFTLTDAQKALELAGKLTASEIPDIEARRHWNKSMAAFPDFAIFQVERTNPGNFNTLLEQVRERSPLAEWTNEEDGRIDQPLQFRIRDPLVIADLQTPETGKILTHGKILGMLKPLDLLPANPEAIRAILLDFYTPRGMTPKINLVLDDSPRTLSIFETTRIAKLLLPAGLKDLTTAEEIVYESLPQRASSAFREKGQALLQTPLDPAATKREIDLSTLDIDPVPLDPLQLAAIQQRLQPLKYTASIFDLDPDKLLYDLVIDAVTPEKGAASAEHPPNAPQESLTPLARSGGQPVPLVPARPPNPRRVANTARPEHKNFIGAGFEYKPGQGVRGLASYKRADTLVS